MYRSKFEATIAKRFSRDKVKAKYEPFSIQYLLQLRYHPDWVLPNGVILEAKGELDAITRRKMVAVKEQNPGLDIRFIFMRASNKLRKGSKVSYAKWAEDHGFPWCEGYPPREWFV